MVATAVIGIGLGAIMTVNSQVLRMARDTRHTNAASLMLQARVEQMRNTSWDSMITPSHLQSELAVNQSAGSGIPNAEVRIEVSEYNPNGPTALQPIEVKRAADGTASILNQGGNFDEIRLARVDVAVSWVGTNGRQRTRESSTIISNNGVSKNYVPMMGNFAGGAFDDASGTNSGTGGTDSGNGGTGNGNGGTGNGNGGTGNGGTNHGNPPEHSNGQVPKGEAGTPGGSPGNDHSNPPKNK